MKETKEDPCSFCDTVKERRFRGKKINGTISFICEVCAKEAKEKIDKDPNYNKGREGGDAA